MGARVLAGIAAAGVALLVSIGGCSNVVGADFDDLHPLGSTFTDGGDGAGDDPGMDASKHDSGPKGSMTMDAGGQPDALVFPGDDDDDSGDDGIPDSGSGKPEAGKDAGGDAATCDPLSCAGCCTADGKCADGVTSEACGYFSTCTVCNSTQYCDGYSCKCAPQCTGKVCGDADGCGGLCNVACPSGYFCPSPDPGGCYACYAVGANCTASDQCCSGNCSTSTNTCQ